MKEQWKFAYKACDVLKGAQKKHKQHTARLTWWEKKLEEVKIKIKAEGIEIDESLADMVSNSYARGPSVQIRDDLVRDVQECVGKTQEHRQKVDDYACWIQVLMSQGHASLDLTHDDWLYFFRE